MITTHLHIFTSMFNMIIEVLCAYNKLLIINCLLPQKRGISEGEKLITGKCDHFMLKPFKFLYFAAVD